MYRKLYALAIFLGTIGFLVLVYLYFFVYYTATLEVSSNVDAYRVELFSTATAQKRTIDCPEKVCIISDVSPFDYNINFYKSGYEPEFVSMKVQPRVQQEIVIELQKRAFIEDVENVQLVETTKEKITRLREQNRFFAFFPGDRLGNIAFEEDGEELILYYKRGERYERISRFPGVRASQLYAEEISGRDAIFLALGNTYYIFHTDSAELEKLPFQVKIEYIKGGVRQNEYQLVTEKGTFIYDVQTGNSRFEYQFRDFLYLGDELIGVIYEDEQQKKKNFSLEGSDNLIIRYNPQFKTRKILLRTDKNIDRMIWQGEKIILRAGEEEFELKNF